MVSMNNDGKWKWTYMIYLKFNRIYTSWIQILHSFHSLPFPFACSKRRRSSITWNELSCRLEGNRLFCHAFQKSSLIFVIVWRILLKVKKREKMKWLIPEGINPASVPSTSSTVEEEPNFSEYFTERYWARDPEANRNWESAEYWAFKKTSKNEAEHTSITRSL